MASPYDEWRLKSPYDLLPRYSVRCRICCEFFDPADCREIGEVNDGVANGICKECEEKEVEE
jgi:hypothetical protein